jgi:hypothetical protein
MGQQVRVKDELTTFYDEMVFAAGTTGAIDTFNSVVEVDLGGADLDEESPGELIISARGMTSGGSATLNVQLFDATATGGSYAAITPQPIETGAVAFDDGLWAGNDYKLRFSLPAFGLRRALQVNYVIGAATITAGTLSVWYARNPK